MLQDVVRFVSGEMVVIAGKMRFASCLDRGSVQVTVEPDSISVVEVDEDIHKFLVSFQNPHILSLLHQEFFLPWDRRGDKCQF